MAKRTATSELNHDNWNKEEVPEEAGTFRKATSDVIQNRVIKAAKRRSVTTSENSPASKSPFAAFGGFKATSTDTSSTFSFLSNTNTSGDVKKCSKKDTSNGKTAEIQDSNSHSPEYYSSLKGLNQSVSQWIKSHVDSNPFCILTPVFKDYQKHLEEIDEKETKKSRAKSPEKSTPTSTTSTSTESTSKPVEESSRKDVTNSFTFSTNTPPKFNFGSGPTSAPTMTAGFTFAGSQPFTFSNVIKQEEKKTSSSDGEDKGEEDEGPPKVEFKPVMEEGAVYNKRCKVFVKKDSSYQERGVGTLFLKPVGEKTQLIVRAETSLGNVILNTLLMAGMPLQRMGANIVVIACIPTPDAQPTPVPVLLRLKTGADADEVLEKMKQYMK